MGDPSTIMDIPIETRRWVYNAIRQWFLHLTKNNDLYMLYMIKIRVEFTLIQYHIHL
jgi:hypothetical protein